MAFKDQVNTEQHTKEGFIMPFIKELGYDVFNPFEVTPELVADGGIKQDEKIDYTIIDDPKKEIKNERNSLDDIFNFSDLLIKAVEIYDKQYAFSS